MNESVYKNLSFSHLLTLPQIERISHFLQPGETPPSMLLDRTDDEEGVSLPSPTTREFSHSSAIHLLTLFTGLLGFDGVVLEVSESGQVVSLVLF